MSPDQQPATQKDLADLEARLTTRMQELEGHVIEQMREMQTEILRGLEAFARGNFSRMHNLETHDKALSDSQFATNDRITALEERVLNLEVRRPRP